MQHGHGQIEGRFGVRRIEPPRFPRMLIGPHRHMERLFDVGDAAVHVEDQPVGMGQRHGQAVGGGEIRECLIVRRARPESLGKLRGG